MKPLKSKDVILDLNTHSNYLVHPPIFGESFDADPDLILQIGQADKVTDQF
jgi:hypothetical protein